MTTIKEIRDKKDGDLAKFIAEKREEVRAFRFGTKGQNSAAVRVARRDIARALTELQARNVAAPAVDNAE